ncbi:hypothetical protein CWO01_14820 [Vibrio splendidus]|uniref:hypothetical protein n=1 Tax=Vibrio splendidus TaxID=29497 RepID=UPI000D39DD2F|nr:hypothetical protein [Vibrio splendidus]PTP60920.1 hypothetical protein CWO01_14820 [Vibrio splendidus]
MYLFNDKEILNTRYRSGLIEELNKEKASVSSVGVFDSYIGFVKATLILLFTQKKYISSNMKCNILCMLFFWKRGTIIINGLGRNKINRKFRRIMAFLFLINKNKEIIFQNYADYRFFRLNQNNPSIFWVPGSGGNMRATGQSDNITIVSRDNKINYSAQSILKIKNLETGKKIYIVGCSKEKIKETFNDTNIIGCGYVNQEDIFGNSKIFFQPSGYGEGVPHTLVDAMCSDMKILISKKDFLSFGLHKLNFNYKKIDQDIIAIEQCSSKSAQLENKNISLEYCDIILRKEVNEFSPSLSQ